jgi:hypothetical protein
VPPLIHLTSPRTTSCHTSFPWSQDEFAVSISFFSNSSSRRLTSRAETEILNPHYRRRPPSPDRRTPSLHCFKKVILILVTLTITQLCLHFTSSLARASLHQSSTCHRRFISLMSHAHCSFSQQQLRFNRIYFAFRTYRYINSRYFKISLSTVFQRDKTTANQIAFLSLHSSIRRTSFALRCSPSNPPIAAPPPPPPSAASRRVAAALEMPPPGNRRARFPPPPLNPRSRSPPRVRSPQPPHPPQGEWSRRPPPPGLPEPIMARRTEGRLRWR